MRGEIHTACVPPRILQLPWLRDLYVLMPAGSPNQGFLSRYIMSQDEGQKERTEQAYRQLAVRVLKKVDAWVDTKPMRIPSVTVVLECEK